VLRLFLADWLAVWSAALNETDVETANRDFRPRLEQPES